jgi:hypothetical protein
MEAHEVTDRGEPAIPADWFAEFEAASRRSLKTRFRYSFIHTYKPVLDDAPFRAFDWLGYACV